MSGDFNIKIGQGNLNQDSLQSNSLKRDYFKNDAAMLSIFNAIDDGNGILDNNEIARVNQMIQEAAAEDGNSAELSEQEGNSLLNKLGLSNLKIDSLINFLGYSSKIKSNTNVTYNQDNSYTETNDVATYDYDKNGNMTKITLPDGRYTEFIYNDDGTVTHKTNDGMEFITKDDVVTGGKDANGTYKMEYTSDGICSQTYTDGKYEGSIFTYNKDGIMTGRKNADGTEFAFTYGEDGSYTSTDVNSGLEIHYKKNNDGSGTSTDSYGRTCNFDKDGKLTSGSDKYGNYEVRYNEDGTSTLTYTDGARKGTTFYYDKNGKSTRRVNPDNTSYKFIHSKNGDYTAINEQTQEETNWTFSKDGTYSTTLADGSKNVYNYEVSYNESTMSSGAKIYQSDNGGYAKYTRKGEIKTTCRRNETFEETMKRLGITSEQDQALFKAANKKAAKRGRFIYGANDIVIPKSIASKIKMTNVLKPQMGI